ncbi:MAG: DUF4351 domain-containing protein [Rhodoferax sp.]|nr:DUF4351 domain-containing protein [Rhodoferax sp.]
MLLPEVQTLKEIDMALADRITQWAESYKAQGVQVGLLQGRRVEALSMLERLLQRRFGDIPPAVHERLQSASAEGIEAWFDRAITASSLFAVFDESLPNH